ncbi:MBL fold metallo-hydrolase [Martelella mediterranea]|uniref:MBL fold metallo-hydrolase n=1 Tax=Martelella mediterranea TaxID=293089 RepID=UPI001E4EC9AD|nr:MBL fold metallo-hydrolase [Martelella mediterranea]MCD1636406.1 MBL fold metallo-hydrolase [Martelella mediterranea]
MRLEAVSGFPQRGSPGLFWLGQAGFWIETGAHRVLIDPYLSDSLAMKYAGAKNDHKRMAAPPILVEDLPRPDLVLVTHAHTDHMDPGTLAPLAARFPDLAFVVPAARASVARERIGEGANLVPVDAGEVFEPLPGLELTVFPAAHEALERDEAGRHVFLGYGIASGRLRIYHSGDSIPFEGLDAALAAFAPDIALLPVNGRDARRLAAGIPGNFHLDEAVALARHTPYLVPHHFGMFAFNTLDPQKIDAAARVTPRPAIVKPALGKTLRIVPGHEGARHGSEGIPHG